MKTSRTTLIGVAALTAAVLAGGGAAAALAASSSPTTPVPTVRSTSGPVRDDTRSGFRDPRTDDHPTGATGSGRTSAAGGWSEGIADRSGHQGDDTNERGTAGGVSVGEYSDDSGQAGQE